MYEDADLADNSVFTTNFVPIFLFNLSDKLHVEAETEFSLNDLGETEVELEYANAHYFLTNTTTLTAGKFLLPFGQFSANFHPSWINRSPWTPGIYGPHDGNQAMEPLLPVLSDVGLALQQVIPLCPDRKVFIDLYVSNGAREELEENGVDPDAPDETLDEELHEELHSIEPEVEFEAASVDNNNNKAVGGRLAVAFLPPLEIGASYYKAKYDDEGDFEVIAKGLDLNWVGRHFIVRGEYIRKETEGLEEIEEDVFREHTFKRNGWYLQGTLQLGRIWPVLGGTEFLLERSVTSKLDKAHRWVYGFNYWLAPRTVIKLAYEDTDVKDGEDDNRVALQFSYAF
ncbi:porin [Microbulbifer magnicolonia]|uniref:porin n=1 Tax=Microbulbifer magnicolonia TaxID=3109744 RepID=UPI002B407834|nr:porin [Microbulbifer sp. GG15]